MLLDSLWGSFVLLVMLCSVSIASLHCPVWDMIRSVFILVILLNFIVIVFIEATGFDTQSLITLLTVHIICIS